jgi:hypothetical protein
VVSLVSVVSVVPMVTLTTVESDALYSYGYHDTTVTGIHSSGEGKVFRILDIYDRSKTGICCTLLHVQIPGISGNW